jgi:large subunit ribosomal protein L6
MSRIGRQPIPVPTGVTISIEPEAVRVNGPKGELSERIPRDIEVKQDGEQLLVTRPTDRGEHRALHGLTRTLVANMVEGVTAGYEKRLEIQGVGYRAQLKGKNLELAVGYFDPGAGRDRVRGAPADAHRGEGHLQAARRGDRRDHPQAAPARAVQGQGHPL